MLDSILHLVIQLALPLLCLVALCLMATRSSFFTIVLVWAGILWSGDGQGFIGPIIWTSPLGVNVALMDIIATVLMGGAILRLTSTRRVSGLQKLFLVYCAIVAISYLRGTIAFGLQSATNNLRTVYYFLSVTLYFSTCTLGRHELRNIMYTWFAGTGILVALAMARWSAIIMPSFLDFIVIPPKCGLRVLYAIPAFLLAQSLLILILTRRRRWSVGIPIIATAILAITVLLLQHRTVWVVLIVTGALVIWKKPALRSRVSLVAVFVLLLLIVMGLTIIGPQIFSALKLSATRATSAQSTFTWRIAGWRALFSHMSATDYLFGMPFGESYFIEEIHERGNISPHSLYVSIIARVGLPGLLLFVGLYLRTLGKLAKYPFTTETPYLSSSILWFLLVGQLVYGIAYSLSYSQGIFLGLAMAMATCKPLAAKSRINTRIHGALYGEERNRA